MLFGPGQGESLTAETHSVTRLPLSHSSNYIAPQHRTETREGCREEIALRRSKRILEKQGKRGPSSPRDVNTQAVEEQRTSVPLEIDVSQYVINQPCVPIGSGQETRVEHSQFDVLGEHRWGSQWRSVGEGGNPRGEVEGELTSYLPNKQPARDPPPSLRTRQPKAYTFTCACTKYLD